MSEDIAKLESWAVVFTSPADLPNVVETNVTHNLIKLTRKLNEAKNEWKAETYYSFGTTLGEMVVIATQPLATVDTSFPDDPYDPSKYAFGDSCATRTDDDCAAELCPSIDHCRWSWDPNDPQKWSGNTARCRCDVVSSNNMSLY